MRMRWVSAVLITAIAGVTACSSGGSSTTTSSGGTGTSTAGAAATNTPGTTAPSTSSAGGGNSSAPSGGGTSSSPAVIGPSNGPTDNAAPSSAVSFTVPSIAGDNIVTAEGSYQKIGSERLKVTVCATQTGKAFAVGAVAYAYNSAGAYKNIGATVLTGVGDKECGTLTFLFYTAHLKVHAFIGGSNGEIAKTGPVLSLF
jgi:hypothetical protein